MELFKLSVQRHEPSPSGRGDRLAGLRDRVRPGVRVHLHAEGQVKSGQRLHVLRSRDAKNKLFALQ